MGTLNAALGWARRGFPVFPLRENSREPALGDNWTDIATTDESLIRSLWLDPVLGIEKDYNVGCLCTDMVVVDIDVKNGKDGYNEYMQLGGHFDTLTVRTTTGGYHCYFLGPDSSNASVSRSVDIRSHNGYVVAPGSTINGIPYEVINDTDMAWVPDGVERLLKEPNFRREVEYTGELDTPASVDAAIKFLESTPVAIEGMGGDETTFITAARLVREMALSVTKAFQLMRDYWNDRCNPPWELSELYQKVENAYQYGSADLGRLTPEVLFGQIEIQEPPTIFEQLDIEWGNGVMPQNIAPRAWLMGRMLMRRAVTMFIAPGSAGKSSASLALAAHLSAGKDFAGHKCFAPCKTVVYNGEDDLLEQSRRLLAVCIKYGFDYAAIKKNILLLSSRDLKLDLVHKDGNRIVRNDTMVKQLIAKISDPDVGLLILDPLVKVHKCSEDNNVEMDFVMDTITDIAQEANVSVLILHHSNKGNDRAENRTGNMDISRGASAIINAARIAFTMLNATREDAEEFGLDDEERNMWVRMDDAKMNLSLASSNPIWFRKQAVSIPSGDDVGTLEYAKLEQSHQHLQDRMAALLWKHLTSLNAGSMTLPQAVAVIRAGEPLLANKLDKEIKQRLETFFYKGYRVEGAVITFKRDDVDPAKINITLT